MALVLTESTGWGGEGELREQSRDRVWVALEGTVVAAAGRAEGAGSPVDQHPSWI